MSAFKKERGGISSALNACAIRLLGVHASACSPARRVVAERRRDRLKPGHRAREARREPFEDQKYFSPTAKIKVNQGKLS